jgi:hypothetical protein
VLRGLLLVIRHMFRDEVTTECLDKCAVLAQVVAAGPLRVRLSEPAPYCAVSVLINEATKVRIGEKITSVTAMAACPNHWLR